jgi:5-oxoprolinase (ATP-hydrolysing)
MSVDEVAQGFLKVANESMCRPIRALTQGKGFNAQDHILACFGGAGGQHAFAIARSLGIHKILIHRYAAILSAYGQALADVVDEVQEPCAYIMNDKTMPKLKEIGARLVNKSRENLKAQGFPDSNINTELYFNLRYKGTDTAIMTLKPSQDDWNFKKVFLRNYEQEFGFILRDRDIMVDDIRVRGIGKSIATGQEVKWTNVHKELKKLIRKRKEEHEELVSVYWEATGRVDTPIYILKKLVPGDEIAGPALIIDDTSTVAVEPNCTAVVTSEHIVGFVGKDNTELVEDEIHCDPIMLSVFGHRFMSIAEQMGRTLQKTSISTNIKERLDFSCALFGPDGGLVANAPHIPVHLGSMQEAVKWQMKHLEGKIEEGDVLVTNHPMAGGSHLPDITVITPVFDHGNIVFFVASRGHHADIGGKRAGSMPNDSKELFEEGASIKSFLLVKYGKFDQEGITKILLEDPAKYPGCQGTRCLKDNISDLKAQVAANHRGIQLVHELIKEYGLKVVQAYMNFIQQNAHHAVSDMLRRTCESLGPTLIATDQMDDGTKISLTVRIDEKKGTAEFDFAGTGPEVYANTNAPRSVTYSAIIYCLRCLINLDMPLNQGALGPITVKIPEGCLLNPTETSAVVGGNVLTSQRLCDVIFKAFEACAASQGCCNNFTFGKDVIDGEDGFGYYETIAGGSGAGPTWHGRSGVHTHMTNTRITDPEIMERRYPVILREFSLRPNSGGRGEFVGGDGVVREIEFLESLQVSILSERRVFQPYGYR